MQVRVARRLGGAQDVRFAVCGRTSGGGGLRQINRTLSLRRIIVVAEWVSSDAAIQGRRLVDTSWQRIADVWSALLVPLQSKGTFNGSAAFASHRALPTSPSDTNAHCRCGRRTPTLPGSPTAPPTCTAQYSAMLVRVASTHFDEWIAQRYETLWPELFAPSVVEPAVNFLADLAQDGAALELGIGTGRLAIPLSQRGVRVRGIELSPAMVAELRTKPGSEDIDVTVGDFASARMDGTFTLAYLARNTITNLTTQDEQVECFRNVAAHLEPGGCFVIENYVPELQRLPPGETVHVFAATPDHLGFEEYDFATQIAVSHHYWTIDGRIEARSGPHRYVWPSELDLMARLAGMTLRERWRDWHRGAFTSESRSHVSVWEM